MQEKLEGKQCLISTKDGVKKAKIVKVFSKVGFFDHGETYVTIVFENCGSIWSGDGSYRLKDIKVL